MVHVSTTDESTSFKRGESVMTELTTMVHIASYTVHLYIINWYAERMRRFINNEIFINCEVKPPLGK